MSSIIIVGSGLSGLMAARVLDKASLGYKITILEGRDRVGGQAFSRQEDKIGSIDMGGDHIVQNQKCIMKLAEGLGVQLFKAHEAGFTYLDTTAEGTYFTDNPKKKYNPVKILDRNSVLFKLETMSQQVPMENPWKAPKAKKWDSVTFEQFMDKAIWTRTIYCEVRLAIRAILCCEMNEVSLLSVLWTIRRIGGVKNVFGLFNQTGTQKLIGGSQGLCQRMMDDLSGSCSVKLGDHVTKIVDDKQSNIKVTTFLGKSYEADAVILALPLKAVLQIQFQPVLHGMKRKLLEKMQVGSVIKTYMFYKDTFWKATGHSGEVRSDYGPAQYTADATAPPANIPCLAGYIIGKDVAAQSTNRTTTDRNHDLGKFYERIFHDERFTFPSHYFEKVWTEDPFVAGWGVYFPPGVLTTYAEYLREPHGRVHFAGSEVCPIWGGFMEGALLMGERTAKNVMEVLSKKSMHHIEKEDSLARGILDLLSSEQKPPASHMVSVKHVLVGTSVVTGMIALGLLLSRMSAQVGNNTLNINFELPLPASA